MAGHRFEEFIVRAGAAKPSATAYLRDMTTQLYYCDQSCYSEHCTNAVMNLAHRTKVALAGLAPVRSRRLAKTI